MLSDDDLTIRIWIPGIPAPGGSKKGFAIPDKKRPGKYRAILTEDSRRSKPWRQSVEWGAREVFRDAPLQVAIAVIFKFFMPRPKSHYGKRGLRPSAPAMPTVKPDVTKLIRSTEDALKGIAWIDDSMIVDQHGRKVYGDRPGALITIRRAAADTADEYSSNESIIQQLGMRFLI